MDKLKIYLADLRYYVGGTCFPLSLGYLSAFTQEKMDVDIRMFIDPNDLADAIRKNPPDVLGLANYSWNRNINTQFVKFTKDISSKTVTVMGGPAFARQPGVEQDHFFERNPSLDCYLAGAGEFAFVEALHLIQEGTLFEKAFKTMFLKNNGKVEEGQREVEEVTRRRKDIDEIPSPYLTGIMDEFFDVPNLNPMVETFRGCPYACTFCSWGSKLLNKVSMFSVERVKAEIDYIAERVDKSTRLYFGDSNFGILVRDLEIAQHVSWHREKNGWPQDAFMYFAKNHGQRVIEIAKLLKGMTKVSMSRQSMTDSVLENTKRANLDDATYARIQEEMGAENIETMVELIYPLPGETIKSFKDGLNKIFDTCDPHTTEIRLYPLDLYPGTEIADDESRKKFNYTIGWRRLWKHSGVFSGIKACEWQELVVETNAFSLDDFCYVRKLHFFICLLLTYRLFSNLTVLYYKESRQTGIIALIEKIIEEVEQSEILKPLFDEFKQETMAELHFEGEPPPDSIGEEQMRFNIFYGMRLLYEDGLRLEFERVFKKVLTEDFALEGVEQGMEACETRFVDYRDLAKQIDMGMNVTPAGLAEEQFIKMYNGNLIDTLYKIYPIVAQGNMGKIVLKNEQIALQPA